MEINKTENVNVASDSKCVESNILKTTLLSVSSSKCHQNKSNSDKIIVIDDEESNNKPPTQAHVGVQAPKIVSPIKGLITIRPAKSLCAPDKTIERKIPRLVEAFPKPNTRIVRLPPTPEGRLALDRVIQGLKQQPNEDENDEDDGLPNIYYCTVQDIEVKTTCMVCQSTQKLVKFHCKFHKTKTYICSDKCVTMLQKSVTFPVVIEEFITKFYIHDPNEEVKYVRQCVQCAMVLTGMLGTISWEALDFCKEHCLYRYQSRVGKYCFHCGSEVGYAQLGKYSVRFGTIIRQFCSGGCIQIKKKSINICSYCQKRVTASAISYGKNQFYCHDICKGKYDFLQNPKKPPFLVNPHDAKCYVCKSTRPIEIEFIYYDSSYYFCTDRCCTIFKFVQNCNPMPRKCETCCQYMLQKHLERNGLHYEGYIHYFCSLTCQHIYVITHRQIVSCVWCKVKKYNFDMIQKANFLGINVFLCSLGCLNALQNSIDYIFSRIKICYFCHTDNGKYELQVADGSLQAFCSNTCIIQYQGQMYVAAKSAYTTTKRPARGRHKQVIPDKPGPLPIITNVCSLAPHAKKSIANPPQIKKIIIVQQPEFKEQRNVCTSVAPQKRDQETQMEKNVVTTEMQTEIPEDGLVTIPIPVPIFIPNPIPMWKAPVAIPVPFPLVIPAPVLIPLTKKTGLNIMKSLLKKPTVKAPTDPFEAELLMMAELVAAEKKDDAAVDAGADLSGDSDNREDSYSPEPADSSGTLGDDMLQMALVMASDYEEPAVDLEGALTASTITASQPTPNRSVLSADGAAELQASRGRKRPVRQARQNISRRGRRSTAQMNETRAAPPQPLVAQPVEPVEKPDANMCLKYTFGVNAWKQWVSTKNIDLERSSRRLKLFKTELLQLTSDELNYSLCLFVKEVRKPNGSEYAPDTIYYLCLGIQQYLYENGRIDNIFCDTYYEKFTECLDDVCKKFSALYNDSHYIVTRVEEEHLWESKQLGAHSPHVLLSTLMFFNTKHFNLTNVDEHMQLSFSHIMKHWKRNANQPGIVKSPGGSRNVLLRFYPPQASLDVNSRKKKVYEQQENEENPLRCPVKLYEFYLSKCPESVKTRNDVFYLMPERSCVPDSPVWYSTMALDRPPLEKMLHRVKMVKEINVALLTS